MSKIILSLWILLAAAVFAAGQDAAATLPAKGSVSVDLVPGNVKVFSLPMADDEIAAISSKIPNDISVLWAVADRSGRILESGEWTENGTAYFIAPRAGEYHLLLQRTKDDAEQGKEVTVSRTSGFELPQGAKLKDSRTVAGYEIKIYSSPDSPDAAPLSLVTFSRSGRIKRVLSDYGGTVGGYSFADSDRPNGDHQRLIRSTPDMTGNGVPDVWIEYYSGGAHCCTTEYFYDLGPTVELAETIDTQHAGMSAIAKNPKGGLRFITAENNFAYWNACYACSPMPRVILEFDKGKLVTRFDLMKKPAQPMAKLRTMANKSRAKIGLEPYVNDGEMFSEVFWAPMLDLIYTGHEKLAWQYFEMVWPAKKQGKALFRKNFEEVLATGYYGTKDPSGQNGLGHYWKGMTNILEKIKEK